jgi:hypothetical protein
VAPLKSPYMIWCLRTLLRRSFKNPPPTPHDIGMFRFMITSASCSIMMGKNPPAGDIPKCGVVLMHSLVLGSLFWECLHPGTSPHAQLLCDDLELVQKVACCTWRTTKLNWVLFFCKFVRYRWSGDHLALEAVPSLSRL